MKAKHPKRKRRPNIGKMLRDLEKKGLVVRFGCKWKTPIALMSH